MADRGSPRGAAIYATWPMRGAARACYTSWRERGPLAAVDAENRSLRKASTPPGPHVVTDLPPPQVDLFDQRIRGGKPR